MRLHDLRERAVPVGEDPEELGALRRGNVSGRCRRATEARGHGRSENPRRLEFVDLGEEFAVTGFAFAGDVPRSLADPRCLAQERVEGRGRGRQRRLG